MSAQRYGGKFSPDANTGDAANRFRGRAANRSSVAAKLLFLVPLPLLLSGLGEVMRGNPAGMLAELGALALLLLGAWLTNEGLKAEEAYHARKIARPPSFPRKLAGAVMIAAGVALAGWMGWGIGLFGGLVFGAVAAGCHIFAFGPDPMKKKGLEGFDAFETDRVARAIEKAEAVLAEMESAGTRLKDRHLEGRIDRLAASAREVFRALEEDPRDLSRARKFLSVYLMGARDATVKFADLWTRRKDPEKRAEYEALLGDLETSFNTHRETLLLDDQTDLDVEIEVLRERLKQEGLTAQ
jgi:hypothetical protein